MRSVVVLSQILLVCQLVWCISNTYSSILPFYCIIIEILFLYGPFFKNHTPGYPKKNKNSIFIWFKNFYMRSSAKAEVFLCLCSISGEQSFGPGILISSRGWTQVIFPQSFSLLSSLCTYTSFLFFKAVQSQILVKAHILAIFLGDMMKYLDFRERWRIRSEIKQELKMRLMCTETPIARGKKEYPVRYQRFL